MTLNFERISVLKTKIWSKTKNLIIDFNVHRMASFLLLSVMLPMVYTPGASVKVEADSEEVSSNSLKLSLNSPSVVLASDSISEIKPGESKVEREAREAKEKAEAEAKAAAEAKAKASRTVVARENRVYSDPSNFDEIYVRAQNAYGVDARILSAIHQVETGRSGSSTITNHSGSGATGPMQFMPSTWRRYGVDGNGDGIADINNVEDAIFSAAKYLKACGYPNVQKALYGYNPSTSYYNKVMNIAHSLGF
jgi:hypothetical protein